MELFSWLKEEILVSTGTQGVGINEKGRSSCLNHGEGTRLQLSLGWAPMFRVCCLHSSMSNRCLDLGTSYNSNQRRVMHSLWDLYSHMSRSCTFNRGSRIMRILVNGTSIRHLAFSLEALIERRDIQLHMITEEPEIGLSQSLQPGSRLDAHPILKILARLASLLMPGMR